MDTTITIDLADLLMVLLGRFEEDDHA